MNNNILHTQGWLYLTRLRGGTLVGPRLALRARGFAETVGVLPAGHSKLLREFLEQGLPLWLFTEGAKVSSGTTQWYRSNYGTDFENLQTASFYLERQVA